MERKITLAGGCFWGVQAFFDQIKGVKRTVAGYANGQKDYVNYEMVSRGNTRFAEAVQIIYDDKLVTLEHLLNKYFQVIDPTIKDRQGNDVGNQYRTGIFYSLGHQDEDLPIIQAKIKSEQKRYNRPIVVEVEPLKRFVIAENYHQKYLEKHPFGYCHIDLKKARDD